jgi:hypothetical protein
VLRVLIKWIEELDGIVMMPQKNLVDREAKNLDALSYIESRLRGQYYKLLAKNITDNFGKQFDKSISSDMSILDSAYKSLSDYINEHMG